MGTFTSLTLPLSGRTGAGPIALEVVATFPGTRGATLTPDGGVAFELHFPGNLTALVQRLASNGFVAGPARVTIPTVTLAPERQSDPSDVAAVLNHGPHVWDPEFHPVNRVVDASLLDGAVEATIEPTTTALHQLYDSMLHLGLTAKGPTPAGAR